jgi:hypothetical protein
MALANSLPVERCPFYIIQLKRGQGLNGKREVRGQEVTQPSTLYDLRATLRSQCKNLDKADHFHEKAT